MHVRLVFRPGIMFLSILQWMDSISVAGEGILLAARKQSSDTASHKDDNQLPCSNFSSKV